MEGFQVGAIKCQHVSEFTGGLRPVARLVEANEGALPVATVQEVRAAREAVAEAPPAPRRAARPAPSLPDDLAAALRAQRAAKAFFDAFTPSQQREYVDWIVEAKRDATRAARIAQAVEWIAEGKKRNWKYESC